MPATTLLDRRIGALFAAFVALLTVALLRATELGTIKAASLRHAAATQQVVNVTIPAERGTITDRNGIELAISEGADEVVADPYLIKQPQEVANRLAPLVARPPATLLVALTKPHTGYVPLAKGISTAAGADVARLHINGITLIPEIRRVYPQDSTAAQVLGTVNWQNQGVSGLEYFYNQVLRGTAGVRRVVNDAIGQAISIDDVRAAAPGKTLSLTIDSRLQSEVEQVLAGVGSTYSPKSATAIVADPGTGAILALANWPKVNANRSSSANAIDDAVGLNYEPGSTFKAITVAGALQDGLVTPDTTFNVPPVLTIGDRQIHDAEPHGYEQMSVSRILQVSSNIGAVEIGGKLGAQRFDYWVHRFGFGAPTGIDLPNDERGIVLHWWQYSGSSMGNLPFGQGEDVTPMQMVAAYDAIANGGVLRPPHVVAAVGGKPQPVPRGRRILSGNVASELRDMLRGVFADGGTASGAQIPGYDMAGKTGTANIAVGGHYSNSEYIASFIGMVPTDAPKLVVAVVVDQPHGAIYGGSVAAPAFQKIVGWAVPYLGINPCPAPCQASGQ